MLNSSLSKQTVVAREESAQILRVKRRCRCKFMWPEAAVLQLNPAEYQLRANRIELPLRLLIEKMGGQVEWQAETKTANAHYGVYDLEYDLSAEKHQAVYLR